MLILLAAAGEKTFDEKQWSKVMNNATIYFDVKQQQKPLYLSLNLRRIFQHYQFGKFESRRNLK